VTRNLPNGQKNLIVQKMQNFIWPFFLKKSQELRKAKNYKFFQKKPNWQPCLSSIPRPASDVGLPDI